MTQPALQQPLKTAEAAGLIPIPSTPDKPRCGTCGRPKKPMTQAAQTTPSKTPRKGRSVKAADLKKLEALLAKCDAQIAAHEKQIEKHLIWRASIEKRLAEAMAKAEEGK